MASVYIHYPSEKMFGGRLGDASITVEEDNDGDISIAINSELQTVEGRIDHANLYISKKAAKWLSKQLLLIAEGHTKQSSRLFKER